MSRNAVKAYMPGFIGYDEFLAPLVRGGLRLVRSVALASPAMLGMTGDLPMTTPTVSLSYHYELPGRRLLEIIKHAAKTSFQMVGTTLESAVAIITFLGDQSTINFHLASDRHLTVRASARRAREAHDLCRQLVGRQVLKPIHAKPSAPARGGKPHRPAHVVLAEHMRKTGFADHIVVLPEALAEAPACVFEHDGTLDRYLTGLLAFAQLKADPMNALRPDEFLGKKAGLGHFGGDLGEQAKQRYARDYRAMYKGAPRLFPMHVTLGAGLNPRACMSIYFDWDPVAQKLILARFGRHGRGA